MQIQKDGKSIFTQTQTFAMKVTAKIWITKKAKECASGSLSEVKNAFFVDDAIDRYVKDSRHDIGKRLCCTKLMRDSSSESSLVADWDQQTHTPPPARPGIGPPVTQR